MTSALGEHAFRTDPERKVWWPQPNWRESLAAKMVGRWRSGAPLALAPERDDLELAADPQRNNAFAYADDPKGLRVPRGAHIRRINPRDSLEDTIADVKRHRIVRRGMRYGPQLPDAIGDDGVDRGAAFLIIGASIARQFEFLQRVWSTTATSSGSVPRRTL